MGHHHSTANKNLGVAILLNAIVFIVELTGGLFSRSLALISDAMHNLSDVFALILSYIAYKAVLWDPNKKKTYGYGRVEIFVALINSMSLVFMGIFIIYEAVLRLVHPKPVLGLWMLLVASVGFVANIISTLMLRGDAEHNLNAKSAYLHLFTDALESLAVIFAGGLIYWLGWNILDPVISIAIGVFIIKSAWDIVLETLNILTEGTPNGIDINKVAALIESFPEVKSVHHIHVWSLSSELKALSAHVVVKDISIRQGSELSGRISAELECQFHINHPTLQLEAEVCDEPKVLQL